MKKFALLFGLLCPVLLAGCGEADQCSGFPTKLDEPIARIYALPNAAKDIPAVASAKTLIESCYPETSYADRDYLMVERDVKKLHDDEYVLTYAFDGISDIRIAFRVSASGRIVSAFEISTL